MADNFLEKQMEQYRAGRTVLRQVNPPLDLLLRRLSEQEGSGALKAATDPAERVKEAQMEASLRSARILYGDSFGATVSEEDQGITLSFDGSVSCEREAAIVLVVRLKAAELGFDTAVEHNDRVSVIRFRRHRSK